MSILNLLCPTLALNPHHAPLSTNFGKNACIAFLGGGGKTTLMSLLSRILPTLGFGVVTTTTTRVFAPNTALSPLRSDTMILAEGKNFAQLTNELAAFFHATPHGHITLGHTIDAHSKIRALAPDVLHQTMDALCRALAPTLPHTPLCWLIEADGSAGRPLKAHATHEPVIPTFFTEIVMVAGLDALGQPLSTAIHRPELAVARLNASVSSSSSHITPETLITPHIFAHQLLTEIPVLPSYLSAPLTILLNKKDVLKSTESADLIAKILRHQHPSFPCYAGCLQRQTLRPL